MEAQERAMPGEPSPHLPISYFEISFSQSAAYL